MKICISGPACSGKSHFINRMKDKSFVTGYPESSRKVWTDFPEYRTPLKAFRKKICELQTDLESIPLIGRSSCGIHDRGIMDNLTFLYMHDEELFEKEIRRIAGLYDSGNITPYDLIIYFDVDITRGITPLIKKALDDPLRGATIDVKNYASHVVEFRNAFIEVKNRFNYLNTDVKFIIARPAAEDMDKRNELAEHFIVNFFERSEKNAKPAIKRILRPFSGNI